jgi:hypothetical protein
MRYKVAAIIQNADTHNYNTICFTKCQSFYLWYQPGISYSDLSKYKNNKSIYFTVFRNFGNNLKGFSAEVMALNKHKIYH